MALVLELGDSEGKALSDPEAEPESAGEELALGDTLRVALLQGEGELLWEELAVKLAEIEGEDEEDGSALVEEDGQCELEPEAELLPVRETVPEAQAVGEEEPLTLVECVPDTLEHPEEDSEGEPLVEPLMLWDTVPDTETVVD